MHSIVIKSLMIMIVKIQDLTTHLSCLRLFYESQLFCLKIDTCIITFRLANRE